MKQFAAIWLITLCTGICACGGHTTQAPAQDTDTTATTQSTGAILYQSKCATCHGDDGTAGISGAANLQQSRLDTAAVILLINTGRGAMPAFRASLSEDGIRQVAGYIQTLRK